ncbi:hypothetical protein FHL15_005694 [Xylaria flabelliformis]|uniref:Hemerythrin-like domain-containing protein n=1 Tax=Xylaria flabelliformis TaxID=2512241 RepID=A0A553HZQ0_9PEZI|nr:hypothetical protein FHL15_005694 [Xylaria flabelliformis]
MVALWTDVPVDLYPSQPYKTTIVMASLVRLRAVDRGVLTAKPSSSRAASSGGYGQASGSGSKSPPNGKKVQSELVVVKPWADQPWPLIEIPSRTQQITHPALHIANEIAHIHNAMLRGLNAIYLQAPYVQKPQDITDLLFLTRSWSTWLLDHHDLKESTMLPGFETALGLPAGTLTAPRSCSPSASSSSHSDRVKTTEGNDEGDEEPVSFLLHRVYAYASATHKDPQIYDSTTLRDLLVALADTLVPHLTGQVGLLVSMREMCFRPSPASSASKSKRKHEITAPLPMPMVTITRTGTSNKLPSSSGSPSTSPPVSPSSSTFSVAASIASAASASSSSTHSPPTVSLSLFPSSSTARPNHPGRPAAAAAAAANDAKPNDPAAKDMEVIDTDAKDRLARARTLLEADDRANKLTQIYSAAEARAAASMDRFVVLPMIVRLRDVTAASLPLGPASSAPTLSRATSSSSLSRMSLSSMSMSAFGGVGGNTASEWPRMSIPAVHAIADKLSPRHEGSFLDNFLEQVFKTYL